MKPLCKIRKDCFSIVMWIRENSFTTNLDTIVFYFTAIFYVRYFYSLFGCFV